MNFVGIPSNETLSDCGLDTNMRKNHQKGGADNPEKILQRVCPIPKKEHSHNKNEHQATHAADKL